MTDKFGNKVNSKGYLVDESGNIIDRQWNVVIPVRYLNDQGEIPKLFREMLFKGEDPTEESIN